MFVKICGTTSLADAELAVELGADALGFIFAPSKRRVSNEQAAAITPHLPAHVQRVGVFTDATTAEIIRAVSEAKLSAVQLHAPQDLAQVRQLHAEFNGEIKLWQVVGFEVQRGDESSERNFVQRALAALIDQRIDAVLIDTAKNGVSGGLGETFPWRRAAPLLQQAQRMAATLASSGAYPPGEVGELIVAGGLTAHNVGDAIETLHPWGVDVVSGVEEGPGRKSRDRLTAFLRVARHAR